MRSPLFVCLTALIFTTPLHADNWPAWRGPDGTGQSKEKGLPLTWSTTDNVVWKVPLPDQGNSTPAVWGEKIFITQMTEKGKKRSTICFSTKDGAKLWEKTIEYKEDEITHGTNPHCSASPVTDGKKVVVSHGSAGVFCYDLDGKELWKRDLGRCIHIWGNASSPVIWKDRVFLNFGPGDPTFLIAMNLEDGKDIWKKDVPGGKAGTKKEDGWIGSWSTPILASINGRLELVVSWPETVRSYDPNSGDELWSCGGLTKLVYTSALVSNDTIVAMSGYGGSAIGIKTGGKGDVTKTHQLWRHPNAQQRIGSGVIIGEHIYMMNEPGTMLCIEAKTGKQLWSERAGSGVWGSLVHADGRLYVTNLTGETVVLAAQTEFKELARNKLAGERTLASIAVSNGRLYIRTYKHLWCIGK